MAISKRKRLSLVHCCRTIGVILILLGHANKVFDINYQYDWFNSGQWQRTGGLDFFFIVTGFMMYYLYHKNFGINGKAKEFVLKRALKIYPVYWIFTIATIAIVLVFPQLGNGREQDVEIIIKNLLLLPTVQIIDTTWSLTHVVYFYLIFSLVLFRPKIFKPIVLIWILASLLREFKILPNLDSFIFSFSNLEIIFGSLLAYIVLNYKVNYAKVYLSVGVLGYLLVWINNINGFVNINEIYFYFVSAALIMLGISAIDMKKDTVLPKSIEYLGDASYSIFICQLPIMHFYVVVIGMLNVVPILGNFLSMALVIVLTLLSGCIVYTFIEKPISKYLTKNILNNANFKSEKLHPVQKSS